MAKTVDSQRLQEYCRACLNELHGEKYEIENLPKEVFKVFKQISDYNKAQKSSYPKWLCEACYDKIKDFIRFQAMIKDNTKFLDHLAKERQAKSEEADTEAIFLLTVEPECALKEDDLKIGTIASEALQEKSAFENIFIPSDVKVENDDSENSNIDNSHLADTLSLENPQEAKVKLETNSGENTDPSNVENEENACKICYLTYSTTELLKLHMRIHKELRPFKCDLCDTAYSKRSRLNLHKKEVHPKNSFKIECKFKCGKTFTRSETAKAHYRIKHSSDVLDADVSDDEKPMENIENKTQLETDDESSSDDNFDLLFVSKTTCKICRKSFASPSGLRKHMHLHEEKRPFQCEKCERGFNRKHRLDEHIQEEHAEAPLEIACKYGCGKSFLRFQTAAAHYRKHHPSNVETAATIEPQESNELGTSNDNNLEISDNKSEHNQNAPLVERLTCKVCLQTYSSAGTLRVHMRLHREKLPYQCEQCNRGFNKKARLNWHVAEVHADHPIEYECKAGCGRKFRRLETAKNHYYLKHVLPEKGLKPKEQSYVCEDCGRVFKNLASLREHSYTHRPAEERPFKCEQCGKTFVTKRYFEDHLRRHAGVRCFECTICGAKKVTQRDLRTHIKNNHSENPKTYTCSMCGKIFNRLGNLRLHERVVHQGLRKYECSYCNQTFGKPDTLKHHLMRHTGERPHKCDICDRGFIQAVALRTHMKTHAK